MCFFYLKHSEGEMSKQLEYILKLHRGDCQPDHSATSDEENGDDDAVSSFFIKPMFFIVAVSSGL